MPRFEYSKDGKTVNVDGKTMSVSAFRKQYDTEEYKGLTPDRKVGSAPKKADASEVKKVDSNPLKSKGTQANHHVTDSKNHTKTAKGGGLGGGGALGVGEFLDQIK